MLSDWLPAIIIALSIAAYIQAYNWGWSNGHDVHHSDELHRPERPQPPEAPTLWK